ncbi:cilia- and flagella-associated protein 300-like [Venturia canescens]|uniref:cilia- and flagella-associated protein 300-like n=1 Tax=Venturia canescens TaxID=32260 RepID=UPI001C9C6545|nr:cilia- and flagella-associated protein 300-like [Venturia canescens]
MRLSLQEKMDLDPKYTFVPLPEKNLEGINDKKTGEFFKKWGTNFSIQEYLFNEPFHQYHKQPFAEAFFKNEHVANTLKIYDGGSWMPRGIPASSITIKQIPCSVMNMSFFDKVKNPENKIIHDSGTICKRWDTEIDGIMVSDNLRGMLLDEDSPEYFLYPAAERSEFIFRIFQTLVIGGELCQYEDALEPYLEYTKNFYKNLIRVQRPSDSGDLAVTTMVLEVVAKDVEGLSYYPCDDEHIQNNAFLLIDSDLRVVKTLAHQYSGYFA